MNRLTKLRCELMAFTLAMICLGGRLSAQDGPIVYNRDIRPILSENCFACHGPDEKTREGGLRLDTADQLGKALESRKIGIVPALFSRA